MGVDAGVLIALKAAKAFVMGSRVGLDFGKDRLGETAMRSLSPLAIAAVLLASSLLASACAARAPAYRPYDYFSWSHQEALYYSQWERDTHRQHLDFTVCSDADMREFWEWRHRLNQH